MSIIQGNSLMAYSIPSFETNYTSLGDLLTKEDWNYLIKTKYPEKATGLIKLNTCENGGDDIWRCSDKGKSCGPFMYQQPTFNAFCYGEREKPEDQLDCAVSMIEKGLGPKSVGWYNCWKIENLDQYF